MSVCRSFNNGTGKGVLDLIETMYLRLGKIVVQRVTVIKFGMYYGGCNDTGCFGIKIRTDAAKMMNVRIARFRESIYFVRECEMFVENEAKVSSRVSGVKRRVMYFRKLFKSDEKKFSVGRVRVSRLADSDRTPIRKKVLFFTFSRICS